MRRSDGPPRSEAPLLRLGAVAGIAAAVGAVVANVGHPRVSSGDLNDLGALLRDVAASDSWRLLHGATVVTVVLGLVAFGAIVPSGSRCWKQPKRCGPSTSPSWTSSSSGTSG